MRSLMQKLELLWHVTSFVLLFGAFIPLWRQRAMVGAEDALLSDPIQQLALGVGYSAVILLVLHPKRALVFGLKGKLLWVLVTWVLLSSLWSTAPGITLRRGLSLLLATLYGLLLVVRYPYYVVLRMMVIALAIIIIASLLTVFLLPSWGVMDEPHAGAWRGIFVHKNTFGRVSALALLVFWMLYSSTRRFSRYFWAALAGVAFLALIGSRSVASFVAAAAGIGTEFLLRRVANLPRSFKYATTFVLFALIFLLLQNLDEILNLLGRDTTLTGRIPLWESLIHVGLKRPLVGYGFGAFWQGYTGPSTRVLESFPWAVHAHNGYIDLWLEVGLMGLLLVAALLLRMLTRADRLALHGLTSARRFLFGFMIFSISINLAETTLVESGLGKAMYWIVLSYFYFLTASPVSNACQINASKM